MRRWIGSIWIVGFFGLAAAADAQIPPAGTGGRSYDGNHRLVSSTNVIPPTQRERVRPGSVRAGEQGRSISQTGVFGIPPLPA
jgi:hypothetical protein